MDSCLNQAVVQNAGPSTYLTVISAIWIFLFGLLVGFCCAALPYEHRGEETANKSEDKSRADLSEFRRAFVFTTKYGRTFHTEATCWHLRDTKYWEVWQCKDCGKRCQEASNDADNGSKWIDYDDCSKRRYPANDVYDWDETEVQHAGLHE